MIKFLNYLTATNIYLLTRDILTLDILTYKETVSSGIAIFHEPEPPFVITKLLPLKDSQSSVHYFDAGK